MVIKWTLGENLEIDPFAAVDSSYFSPRIVVARRFLHGAAVSINWENRCYATPKDAEEFAAGLMRAAKLAREMAAS